jgi:hypothetical protein
MPTGQEQRVDQRVRAGADEPGVIDIDATNEQGWFARQRVR